MLAGVLAGYPVVDVKVTLYDGSYHEVDSSEMAFKIAGSMAFKEACQKAGPTLLEPIMKVSVIVPDEYMGDVIGDLNSRRGQIQGFEARSGAQQIDAFVPLAEMFGYATDLRSRTQGRGQYTMEPSHYIEIPKSIAGKDHRSAHRAPHELRHENNSCKSARFTVKSWCYASDTENNEKIIIGGSL